MTDVDEITSEEWMQDKQSKLAAAKDAIAGPVPLIPEAPDTTITLPRGLYVSGSFKKQATFRELNGSDEETLARTKDGNDLFDQVIALGVVSIDDFDINGLPLPERHTWLRMLLIGERDQLFLGIVAATFGQSKVLSFTCSACRERQDVELLLMEDFKPKEIDASKSLDVFDYKTSRGAELVVRLVTGEDQREAFGRKGASVAEQNTIILSRVITKLNGGMVADPMGFARSLSMKDRGDLLAELVSRQPSIDLGVTTKCAVCQNDQLLNLSWGDLFRP